MKRCVLLVLFLSGALRVPAADAPEAGVVEIPAVPADRQEADWKVVEDARGSSGFAVALDAWLLSHPHGIPAARALVEKAALEENLLQAGALLRRARGEANGSAWGSRASLDLAKLEYAQDRAESALLILDEADAWPRAEELDPDWLFWRGQCRLALKGFERARKDLEHFAAAYPHHPKAPQAQLGVAECEAALKQDDLALAGFERIDGDPASEFGAQALWGAAVIRQRQGNTGEAKRLFSRLRSQYPASFEANAAKDHLDQLARVPVVQAKPTPKPSNKPARFYVQVGAFSKRASAVRLQKILRARHYPVLLSAHQLGGRNLNWVKTGPYKTRGAAEAAVRKLKQQDKLLAPRIVED